MKSSSHGRFTSAISIPSRFTLNLIFIFTLLLPALALATPGASIKNFFFGYIARDFDRRPAADIGTLRVASVAGPAAVLLNADPVPQALPYSQDFSALAHSSTNYPAGWQGWQTGTGGSGSAFKAAEPTADLDLSANGSASSTGGAVHNFNGKIGTLSTGSVDPSIVLAIDTTGQTGVTISFDVMTIRNPYNGTTNTRVNEADLQYRVCTLLPCSGAFASASATPGIYQNNSTLQTSGTAPQKSESKVIELPATVDQQLNVQLRWVQRDVSGTGARPSFAIDNISISGGAECTGPTVTLQPADRIVTYGEPSVSFTSTASGDPMPNVHWEVNSGGGFVALPNGGGISGADTTTLTIDDPIVAMSGNEYRAVFGSECDGVPPAASIPASLTVDPLAITVTPDAGQTKVYGDADPDLSYVHSPPLIDGDVFVGGLSRTAGETVGTYGITPGTLSLSSNYILSVEPDVLFAIAPKALFASIAAPDKIYDGTAAAAFSCSLDGIVAPDDVSCSGGNAAFAGENAGVHTVTATGLALTGTDAGQYVLPVPTAAAVSEILARAITVTAVADAKIYDGTAASSGVPIVSVGSIAAGDAADFAQAFDSKHAGTAKTLTPSGFVNDGNGGGNYTIVFANVSTGAITQRPVTVTAVASTKVFDANVTSPDTPTVAPDLAAGDTAGFVQTFDSPDPGTGKTLTPFGAADDGNGGGNYLYTFVAVNSGIITAAYCFDGFHSPIGGSVENGGGGSFSDPVRAFKMNSTIPIKFTLFSGGCGGSPILTGVHTLQMIKYANAVDSEQAIDATPTDAATTGNQFRLSESVWVYNLDTKRTPGMSTGIWMIKATLFDGSVRTAWISVKK
jgi:hypothetical protein